MEETQAADTQEGIDTSNVTKNFDEDLLVTLRVDPSYDEPILHQVLRIAVYDEFHAYETYRKTIEKFGSAQPFTNIMQAEINHFNALELLLVKYNVPAPINDWYDKIEIPDSLVECCEVGVAAEIDNIKMYDNLIMYVNEYPDIKDTLYRLQAASYNNHLPAFRNCVQEHYSKPVNVNNIYEEFSTHNKQNISSNEDMAAKMNEFNDLASRLASGQVSQEDILKFLSNTNLSFLGGALIGAVGMGVISNISKEENAEEEEE